MSEDNEALRRAVSDLRAGLFDIGLMAERNESTVYIAQRVRQVLYEDPHTRPRCMESPSLTVEK